VVYLVIHHADRWALPGVWLLLRLYTTGAAHITIN